MAHPGGALPPLVPEEFAAALESIGGFEARPCVAVAVSGGPDSMALMLLAASWARQRGGIAWGLHVDHGLRPESAAEAETVAGWLARRGIPHQRLRWEGEKPASGIQEAAREARYRLLAEWCRREGCLHLLTAHHLDDQIETHLIRKRARSGPDGLAGMSAIRQLPGLRLLRPLLCVPRARLAAFLAREEQDFLTDPSNQNPAFERVRLRRAMPRTRDTAVQDDVRTFAEQRIEHEKDLAIALARCVALHPGGFAMIEAASLAALAPETVDRVLAAVVLCIGGGRYPPRGERVGRLRAALIQNPDRARTLAGCRLIPWRNRLMVIRELAAAAPSITIGPGDREAWDGRFLVQVGQKATTAFTVDYLRDARLLGSHDPPGDLPRRVWPSLPAAFDSNGLAVVPHLGYRRADVRTAPRIAFRPVNPLIRAGFTVV